MNLVLGLLWFCSIAFVVLVPVLIHELNTPIDPDLAAMKRRDAALSALGRINSRQTIAVEFAARAADSEQTAHAADRPRRGSVAHAGSTPAPVDPVAGAPAGAGLFA